MRGIRDGNLAVTFLLNKRGIALVGVSRSSVADQDDRLTRSEIRATHQFGYRQLVDRQLRGKVEALQCLRVRQLSVFQALLRRTFLAIEPFEFAELQEEAQVIYVLAGTTRGDFIAFAGITQDRQGRRETFLAALRNSAERSEVTRLQDYDAAIQQSLKLSGPEFNRVFHLDGEPDDLRNRYGGEFGQRCLLSRRLVERGVRFIEVSHNLNFLNGAGWDVHNSGIVNQHKLIQEMDTAVSTLITDLEEKHLLDKTLIVITTEFGRPPEFDSGGGRGHQGSAFTCVLAGGGLHHQGAWGETDEVAKKIVSYPVSVPDFFATVGVDYRKNLYDGDRPVPITDRGQPIAELLSS
ncbi:MAG: DUF1501 domain-containing protein [Planctomycetaceae bacterium]|nr:DUF1501 domain-containing protein [Planctomycetaceae bacterium]